MNLDHRSPIMRIRTTASRPWCPARFALIGVVLAASAVVSAHAPPEARAQHKPAEDLPPGFIDDASRMNPTRVAEVWAIPADRRAAEEQLRQLLDRARRQRLSVSVAGARHSMGGHTFCPDGIVVDMLPFNDVELEPGTGVLHAGAGARWSKVIPYLDARGLSPAVMQSNNDFTVGGSLSVNCHGWQPNRPPIASTVRSFRLMKADGTVVRCSRSENAELFSLALGGYGLFGIILDADLAVVPNERYRPQTQIFPAAEYVERYARKVEGNPEIGMAYGRLSIVPGEQTFLREAILTAFRRYPCAASEIPPLKSPEMAGFRRDIFRSQIGSDSGKRLRWQAEKRLEPALAKRFFSRNQLLNEGVAEYEERSASRTDILHEYFVPPDQLTSFLKRARVIIPRQHGELLNVTVRHVHQDPDTVLRYADQNVFALVMLFNHPRTPEADARMEIMTRELVDAALDCGGRYYLPYRPHATPEQFRRAYPQADRFFERKRFHDPGELFRNKFYEKYGRSGPFAGVSP